MKKVDIVIIGAGPVGLMCAHLAQICGLKTIIFDKEKSPTKKGKADALNARTLQFFKIAGIFSDIYPLGKPCNTSSIWSKGQFISRQSSWWNNLQGCLHKHFLMLGQSHVESCLYKNLKKKGLEVQRNLEAKKLYIKNDYCVTTLSNKEKFYSSYVIGADGSHSFVRKNFSIPFEIKKTEIIWAVVDGIIETDFPKVPEIIVFQAETADVAWIPREENLDRFYVRMDKKNFSFTEIMKKINLAMQPHQLVFKKIIWTSQFSVKESVAEKFSVKNRIFLMGDACHVHSVNGGQGLNTGLADAFNLIWKINQVEKFSTPEDLLGTYEKERKPVAFSVIESSGKLVRSTKESTKANHAENYVKLVEKYSGNITGMGIRYGKKGLVGTRVFDLKLFYKKKITSLYSLLDYSKFNLLIFSNNKVDVKPLPNLKIIQIFSTQKSCDYWTQDPSYQSLSILVRPDSYISSIKNL